MKSVEVKIVNPDNLNQTFTITMNPQNIIEGRVNFKSVTCDNLIPKNSCFIIPANESIFKQAQKNYHTLQGSKILTTSKNLFEK